MDIGRGEGPGREVGGLPQGTETRLTASLRPHVHPLNIYHPGPGTRDGTESRARPLCSWVTREQDTLAAQGTAMLAFPGKSLQHKGQRRV